MINHYRTLGVDPQAETVVIRSAYLALIRRYHPDRGGDEADAARAQAVTAAWEVLRDPERRAAYDETRQARFEPDSAGGALAIRPSRARGGAAARNLFLLLAAATIGLGWWALQQPPSVLSGAGATAPRAAMAPARPSEAAQSVPAIRPPEDEQAARRQIAQNEQPRLPDAGREPEVDVPVVLPPLPAAEPARLPSRAAETDARRPPSAGRPQPVTMPARAKAEERVPVTTATPAPARIDLAPLERHLQLLTDQSLRYGTEAKRSRLFATREGFLKRLRDCGDDACRREAYLRRNAEVAEIMRN